MIRSITPLQINTKLAREMIVDFLHHEVTRVGRTRAVVGLSGGIDSSLVAYLTTEALGAKNILGVMMPYRTSNPESRVDAERVIKLRGIESRVVDITPMAEPYLRHYVQDDLRRRGNIMARLRMMILYDLSEEFNGLVIGTSNKTEALLGYTTQFGDNAAALQPIADLYKAQVRQLASAVGVPEEIVAKVPSADLWQGQTDEGELGFTYDEADAILYYLVDERRRVDDVIALGFEIAVVRRIVELMKNNQFKRVPPIIAKISARTIGIDFLYNRDWGK